MAKIKTKFNGASGNLDLIQDAELDNVTNDKQIPLAGTLIGTGGVLPFPVLAIKSLTANNHIFYFAGNPGLIVTDVFEIINALNPIFNQDDWTVYNVLADANGIYRILATSANINNTGFVDSGNSGQYYNSTNSSTSYNPSGASNTAQTGTPGDPVTGGIQFSAEPSTYAGWDRLSVPNKGYVDDQLGANDDLSEILARLPGTSNITGGTDIVLTSGDAISNGGDNIFTPLVNLHLSTGGIGTGGADVAIGAEDINQFYTGFLNILKGLAVSATSASLWMDDNTRVSFAIPTSGGQLNFTYSGTGAVGLTVREIGGTVALLSDIPEVSYIQTGQTSNTTPLVLTTTNPSKPITDNSALSFVTRITAIDETLNQGDVWCKEYRGVFKRVNGNSSLVDVTEESFGEDIGMASASASIDANNTTDVVEIEVTGIALKTINWKAETVFSEVAF